MHVLQITVVWVAASTLLVGLCSACWHLLITGVLQGIGAAIGAVLVSEYVSACLRRRSAASVQSGYVVGYAISILAMPLIFPLLSEHMGGWAFFVLAAFPAVLVWIPRQVIGEPEISLERKQKARV
ncbi:hypothetical protein PJ250_17465 [Pseudoxanthomonas sp. JBR18]|nr:MFS transporter [Pseudoxanthomonas sp. JBR18]WCE03853.1 hypothetical protein PJ250_17465 [Pseudoxanthomonas sp. JBR18]